MGHRQDDGLHQLLNLLVQTTDVAVLIRGALINLHRLHARVVLSRELVQHQVRILVHTDQVVGLDIAGLDQADDRQENRLTSSRLDHDAGLICARVYELIGAVVVVHVRLELQDLGDRGDHVRQLAIQLNLLFVVLGLFLDALQLVAEALLLTLHDPHIVLQKADALLNLIGACPLQLIREDVSLAPNVSAVQAACSCAFRRSGCP
mmetsp:Transcript_121017/g.387456  ORF Transcript_121017/g.387456 Transcript_121017/m.387456 type:complete len:206 (+) Transcript_121017:867-1484(+)